MSVKHHRLTTDEFIQMEWHARRRGDAILYDDVLRLMRECFSLYSYQPEDADNEEETEAIWQQWNEFRRRIGDRS